MLFLYAKVYPSTDAHFLFRMFELKRESDNPCKSERRRWLEKKKRNKREKLNCLKITASNRNLHNVNFVCFVDTKPA